MSHENVEAVRRRFDAFLHGDEPLVLIGACGGIAFTHTPAEGSAVLAEAVGGSAGGMIVDAEFLERHPRCHGERATIIGTHEAETIEGTTGRDVIVARGGDDRINAHAGRDVVCGGGDDDWLGGGSGRDWLEGGPGDDVLLGNRHDDFLLGERGRDRLNGGRRDDFLDGGLDPDELNGGPGDDSCDATTDPADETYISCEGFVVPDG